MPDDPILWSFRRCPYAMRARLALQSAEIPVILREILLRDKPAAFLETSVSGTVPALRLNDRVLDESLDIMVWALECHDPEGLLQMPSDGWSVIAHNDTDFKTALDHTKYATRYPDQDPIAERAKAAEFLNDLNARLVGKNALFGTRLSVADYAILPFVRQFAFIDRAWFNAQPWPELAAWLNRFLSSSAFQNIMTKYPPWRPGDAPIQFAHDLK